MTEGTMDGKKILVVDDESSIRQLISLNLKRSDFNVVEAKDGQEAIDLFNESEGKFDVVLLDVMMPKKDGYEVCREIREKSKDTGIIMLTAKSQERDKIAGLVGGADDYVTKPFSINELLARVDAVYRRVSRTKESSTVGDDKMLSISSGCFELDLKNHTLKKNGENIDLTLIEFKIVEFFMLNPDSPLTRDQITEYVWGKKAAYDDKTLDVNIRRLRKKIEDDPSQPRFIQTLWSVGYVWRK